MAYQIGIETEGGTAVEAGVITEDQAVIVDYVEPEDAPEDEAPGETQSGAEGDA